MQLIEQTAMVLIREIAELKQLLKGKQQPNKLLWIRVEAIKKLNIRKNGEALRQARNKNYLRYRIAKATGHKSTYEYDLNSVVTEYRTPYQVKQ